MADYFTGATPLTNYKLPPSYSTPAFSPGDSTAFRADLGGLVYQPEGMLGSPAAPSPTQPGASPGWGKQWGDLLTGVGRFAGGVGAGIAAAKGDPMADQLLSAYRGDPMAGQLLSAYFQDKTGDTDESGESSLVKALKALQESGIISPAKLEPFKLETGDSDKLLA
jgi:hypothetical protein